jgi:hypothetical protein
VLKFIENIKATSYPRYKSEKIKAAVSIQSEELGEES